MAAESVKATELAEAEGSEDPEMMGAAPKARAERGGLVVVAEGRSGSAARDSAVGVAATKGTAGAESRVERAVLVEAASTGAALVETVSRVYSTDTSECPPGMVAGDRSCRRGRGWRANFRSRRRRP